MANPQVFDSNDNGIGSASANGIVLINGSYREIYGAYAGAGNATASNNGQYTYTEGEKKITNNGVLINVTAKNFKGGVANGKVTATASANIFTMAQGSYGDVTGGEAVNSTDAATATGNEITFDNATVTGTLKVGYANGRGCTADASSNTATVKNGGTYNNLTGGEAEVYNCGTAIASSNQVIFDNATLSTGAVLYGGKTLVHFVYTSGSSVATAEKNTLHIVQTSEAANKAGDVFGGLAEGQRTYEIQLSASVNGIEMMNGSYTNIYGGRAVLSSGYGSATACNNGFYTYTEDGKTVTHKGVLINVTADQFIGGSVEIEQGTATASTNIFTMVQGSYSDVIGGLAEVQNPVRKDILCDATATGNGITFDNATLTGTLKVASASVGSGTADASSNTAIVRNGGLYNNLTGGEAIAGIGTARASSNSVNLDNASLGSGAVVYGGKTLVSDISSDNSTATAERNTLHIAQTSVSANKAGNVFGGLAEVKNTKDGNNLVASANGIEMTNGTYTNIYGGQAVLSGNGSVIASNNGAYTYTDEDERKVTHNGVLVNVTADNFIGGSAKTAQGTATASENIFSMDHGIYGDVIGGQAEITAGSSEENVALAEKNNLVLNSSTSKTALTGGVALVSGTGTAQVSGNEVEMTDAISESGTVTGAKASAEGGVSDAHKNTVTITRGTYKDVNAGQSKTGNGSASSLSNVTTMTNAVSTGTVTGGSSAIVNGTALAQENKAVLTGGTYNNLTGGKAAVLSAYEADETAENAVTSADVPATVSESNSLAAEESSGIATVKDNEVCVTDGTVSGVTVGGLATADASGNAKALSNTVKLKKTAEGAASYSGTVYGSRAVVAENGTAEASAVSVIELDSGNFDDIYGGSAEVTGKGTATATGQVYELDYTTVKYSGSLIAGNATAGKGEAKATSNSFTLSGEFDGNVYAGKASMTSAVDTSDSASAEGNSIIVNDAVLNGGLFSGLAIVSGTGTATVSGNELELTEDAEITSGNVTGAKATAEGGVSDAHENEVTISGGTFKDVNSSQSITGNGSASSLSNTTTMTNAVSTGTVLGGSSAIVTGTALAQKNKALLTGGTYKNLVGGQATVLSAWPVADETEDEATESMATEDASVQNEETALLLASADVPVAASFDDDMAVAAYDGAEAMLLSSDEEVPAVASESTSLAAEGSAGTGEVTESEVSVTDGTVTGVTIGGLANADASGNAKAYSNSVKLKETEEGTASYSGTVYGGLASVAENGAAESYENTFELDSGSFTDIYGGSAEVAGKGTAYAHDQKHELDFTSVTYSGSLIAGNASVGKGQAEVSSNSLALQGGIYTGSVYAGKAAVNNAESAEDSASATGNKVTATDTAVSGDLHAGFAYVDGAGTATVSGNEMYLYGGQYDSNVSAGYILTTDETTEATATDNTMVLALGSDGTSSPVFNAQNSVLYGGYATTDGTTSIYANASNNTMRYEYVKGMTAANIRGFENLEFTLPSICADETVMTLTGGENNESTSIANATAKATVGKVYGKTGGALQIGDKIYLLKNANGLDSTDLTMLPVEYTDGPVISRKGALMAEGLVMETDENSLYLTTAEPDADSSGAKALSEGAAASFALASQATESVIEVIRAVASQEWVVFGRINGAKSRYETGSSIDLTTLSMVAGAGRGFDTGAGFLTVGAFFEYGTGSYTTHNSFETRSDVDGDGQSRYMGGGLMAKMDFKDTGPGHFHADASAHMGNLHNAFDSNDITDEFGRSATFDYDTPYYSVHGTLGYQWNITDSHELDLYGQYIWTKVEGADVDLSTGDIYKFDDMNSNRLRLGATYSYKGNSMFSPYIGAAWEHEFSGSCDATVSGLDVASPSFRGDTLRGELGIKTIASDDMPVTLNLGVQGYTGVRNGISADFYFRYDF